jgi:hypothetical protein
MKEMLNKGNQITILYLGCEKFCDSILSDSGSATLFMGNFK